MFLSRFPTEGGGGGGGGGSGVCNSAYTKLCTNVCVNTHNSYGFRQNIANCQQPLCIQL